MAFDKTKFLSKFCDEAKEHINKLNEGFISLENDSRNSETLNGVFRLAHTIKGSARMMKLIPISEVAHRLEDVLDALRQGKISFSKPLSNLCFNTLDVIDNMLDQVIEGKELHEAPEELCDRLQMAAEGGMPQKTPPKTDRPLTGEPASAGEKPPEPEGTSEKEQTIEPPEKKEAEEKTPKTAGAAQRSDTGPTDPVHEEKPVKPLDTIRISTSKLDELIKLMGEIVSSHSRSKQRMVEVSTIEKIGRQCMENFDLIMDDSISAEGLKKEIGQSMHQLHLNLKSLVSHMKEDLNIQGLLTGDLQDKSLKMRMLPLSLIFDNFRRTVRDLAYNSEKEIDFIVDGGETELDKKIIEKIGDPLIQMIRNSIEHGIEKPAERKTNGKPERGVIRLNASYEGGNVLIELKDDGRGISLQRIKEKAVKRKMIDKADFDNIPDSDIINLIFQPGLSTSDIITDLSGRGVGMDVVKKNIIEDLKGSIHIETEEGKGTAFYIRLPLTMAIIHVLFITVSGITFAVPANYIDEIIRAPENEIITVMDKQAIRLRGQIIPIVELGDVLKLPKRSCKERHNQETDKLVIVVSMGNEKLGIIIELLLNEEDTVIKSLPSHMQNIQYVSGCIISGKNDIFNVLHIPKIIEAAKEATGRDSVKPRAFDEAEEPERTVNILVVDDSVSTREIEKGILESYGYRVTLAGDGMEGFEKAKEFHYDLIISDVEMPNLDGFSLTEKLKADEEYQDTPIILITTRDKEEDKIRGIKAGADAYIIKGAFDQDALLDTVHNLIG